MQPRSNGPRYLWSVLEECSGGVQGVFLPGHSRGGPRDSRRGCGAGRGEQLSPLRSSQGCHQPWLKAGTLVSPVLGQGRAGSPCLQRLHAHPPAAAAPRMRLRARDWTWELGSRWASRRPDWGCWGISPPSYRREGGRKVVRGTPHHAGLPCQGGEAEVAALRGASHSHPVPTPSSQTLWGQGQVARGATQCPNVTPPSPPIPLSPGALLAVGDGTDSLFLLLPLWAGVHVYRGRPPCHRDPCVPCPLAPWAWCHPHLLWNRCRAQPTARQAH